MGKGSYVFGKLLIDDTPVSKSSRWHAVAVQYEQLFNKGEIMEDQSLRDVLRHIMEQHGSVPITVVVSHDGVSDELSDEDNDQRDNVGEGAHQADQIMSAI